jgi:hypothetical protein
MYVGLLVNVVVILTSHENRISWALSFPCSLMFCIMLWHQAQNNQHHLFKLHYKQWRSNNWLIHHNVLHALVTEANKVSQSSPNKQSPRNDLTNQWGPKLLSPNFVTKNHWVSFWGVDESHIRILRAQVRLFGVSIFELSTIGGRHMVACSFSKDSKALQVDTHSTMNECIL